MTTASQRRKYPSLNLEQAIERARVLNERERMNAAPIDVIARHWGFKTINTGPASTAYSAVKQFGLLDETGTGDQRKASLSSLARAILTAPADIRDKHIREAALLPAINRLVWERYGAHTPSPDSFRWDLISEMGFSDTGAREFAKQYEATIRFAGLADEVYEAGEAPSEDESLSEYDLGAAAANAVQHEVPSTVHAVGHGMGFTSTGAAQVTIGTARTSRHAIPLLGGKQVVLEGEFPLTEAAWQGFMTVLAAFKPGLVEQEPLDPPTSNLAG